MGRGTRDEWSGFCLHGIFGSDYDCCTCGRGTRPVALPTLSNRQLLQVPAEGPGTFLFPCVLQTRVVGLTRPSPFFRSIHEGSTKPRKEQMSLARQWYCRALRLRHAEGGKQGELRGCRVVAAGRAATAYQAGAAQVICDEEHARRRRLMCGAGSRLGDTGSRTCEWSVAYQELPELVMLSSRDNYSRSLTRQTQHHELEHHERLRIGIRHQR